MFKKNHPSFFYTKDKIKISYNTNFSLKNRDDEHDGDKGLLLIFNYGLLCSNDHWQYQLSFFDDHEFNILMHDYRAHADSSGDENIEHCTFKNINSDLKELIQFLGFKKNIMIGHSMGVNIALEFAKNNPNLTQGMILISGTVLPPQNVMFDSNLMETILTYFKKFKEIFPNIQEETWKNAFMFAPFRKLVHKGGFNTNKVSENFVHLYMKKIGENHSDMFLKLMEEMKNHDIINHLKSIDIPTLIIGGDQDKVIPHHLQEILQKHLKKSELYIVKHGSHVPQMDFPESINERILMFLHKLNPLLSVSERKNMKKSKK